MKAKLLLIFILSITVLTNFASAKDEDEVSEKSFGILYGVRLYSGRLPEGYKYAPLGRIEAKGEGGMTVERIRDAECKVAYKAKKMGANALINMDAKGGMGGYWRSGEAVIVEYFPDTFIEADFEDFKGPKEYEFSTTIKADYDMVLEAIRSVLEDDELYEIEVMDEENGIVETKETEVPTGKFAWTTADLGGPYPALKIRVLVREIQDGKVSVTEKGIFTKGRFWSKDGVRKSNRLFFRDIEHKIKKLSK